MTQRKRGDREIKSGRDRGKKEQDCRSISLITRRRGVTAGRAEQEESKGGAMGQLCCFPFSQAEEKINLNPLQAKRSSGRRRSEPDEAELLRVSRRLVEDAVNRALQQYKQETLQNGGGPNATALQPPGNTEETATKTDTTANSTTDNRK